MDSVREMLLEQQGKIKFEMQFVRGAIESNEKRIAQDRMRLEEKENTLAEIEKALGVLKYVG